MRNFTAEVKIDASPSRVWDVLSDVERWHEWTPSIGAITPLDGLPLGVGSRARLEQPNLRPVVWEVTSWEPGRAFSWTSKTPGLSIAADHIITPVLSDCLFIAQLRYGGLLGGVVGWRYGELTRRQLRLEVRGLKRRCERTG